MATQDEEQALPLDVRLPSALSNSPFTRLNDPADARDVETMSQTSPRASLVQLRHQGLFLTLCLLLLPQAAPTY